MARPVRFDPGDLVFYKRYQPPADRQERSHQELDVPRRRVARWYGPARVLACETKVTYDGHVRQPHHVAWLIAAGRLKKVHFNQMRHASERERLVAESTTQLTLPWTFQNLSRLINKGEYDDELLTDLQLREQAQAARRLLDEQERAGRAEMKRALESSTASASTGHQQIPEKVRKTSRGTSFLPAETAADDDPDAPDIDMEEYTPSLDPRDQVQDELHPARLVGDPSYLPLGTAEQGPLFQHRPFLEARRRHELLERPHSAQRQEYLQQQRGTGSEGGALLAADAHEDLAMEDYVFAVTLPAPASEAEWRAIAKDPSKFVAKKVAKGVEVGDERDSQWIGFLEAFHGRLRWSPWECAPLHHCGVNMEQSIHGHWHLTQEAFCQEINQVTEDGLTKDLTEHERHQCRAVLGAAQWRCYQSGPQHSSKLSHLQSMLPKGDRNTLKDINRFVKEIYSQKELGVTVYDLKATSDEDIVAVGWSDAALANRCDLSSTGGYVIGFVNKKMLDGHQGPVSIMS